VISHLHLNTRKEKKEKKEQDNTTRKIEETQPKYSLITQ